MKLKVSLYFVLVIFVLISGCKDDDPDIVVVARETWTSDIDQGTGDGEWEFIKWSDNTITCDGEWIYEYDMKKVIYKIHCPFTDGIGGVEGIDAAFTADGTAYFESQPTNTSYFELRVVGTASGGAASGTYVMEFNNALWPQQIAGSWTASRTSGSGITN